MCPQQLHSQVLDKDGWIFPRSRDAVRKHTACRSAAGFPVGEAAVRYLLSGQALDLAPRCSFHTPWVCLWVVFFPPSFSWAPNKIQWGEGDWTCKNTKKKANKKAWARCTHNNTMSFVNPTMWGKKMPSATNWSVARPLSGQAARSEVMAWRHSLDVLVFSFAKLVLFFSKNASRLVLGWKRLQWTHMRQLWTLTGTCGGKIVIIQLVFFLIESVRSNHRRGE